VIYEENQFSKVVSMIHGVPKWLLLGGPADANEAQCAKQHFPDIKVVAFEPLPCNCQWQKVNGFPTDGVLLQCALSDSIGTVPMTVDYDPKNGHRSSSISQDHLHVCSNRLEVITTTLDCADAEYGPFEDAILWLDIEGSELPALYGAHNLLMSGRINWINLEMNSRTESTSRIIDQLLRQYGFSNKHDWNIRSVGRSIIKDVFYRKSGA